MNQASVVRAALFVACSFVVLLLLPVVFFGGAAPHKYDPVHGLDRSLGGAAEYAGVPVDVVDGFGEAHPSAPQCEPNRLPADELSAPRALLHEPLLMDASPIQLADRVSSPLADQASPTHLPPSRTLFELCVARI